MCYILFLCAELIFWFKISSALTNHRNQNPVRNDIEVLLSHSAIVGPSLAQSTRTYFSMADNGGNKEFRKEFEYEFTVQNVHMEFTEFSHTGITAPFNNMRTLKFKVQPTNAFFATANQMFGGST